MKYLTATLSIILFAASNLLAQYESERKFDTFQKVHISDGITAKVFNSTEHKVVLRVSDMPETRVQTKIDGYKLTIKLETGIYEKGQVYAEIYLKELKELDVSSSSKVSSGKQLNGDALLVKSTTSSDVDLELNYNYLEIEAATSSSLELNGKAKIVNATANTSASVKTYELESDTYKAKANTSAEIFIKSENAIEAVASTSGHIYYKGKPSHLKEKSSLSGQIIDAN